MKNKISKDQRSSAVNYKPIAESNNFIVLEKYTLPTKVSEAPAGYQSEAALERELIQDLQNQGYEYVNIKTPEELLVNAREQIQNLNNVQFTDAEWERFVEEYLDKPGETLIDKTRKIQDNHIYDFVFDDGHIENIYLVDKKNIARNKVQVINQFEQEGKYKNRYDVTILVNGLPLVHIELKRRGVALREAFNQVHRYSKESFNTEHSLFKYIQVFVISNGTDTRYFANTTKRDKNSFDFTINWAKADNTPIKDLKDFTATFLQKNTLLQVVLRYSVFDVNNTLLVMRPYQIAATERILWKIQSAYNNKQWGTLEGGGYIWHTTGSGKTLTSFKAARLATKLPFIDKVFFVVDRKDLDAQTIREYKRFSPDSVIGSSSTRGLKRNIERNENKIIVTTIQKLNRLLKSETDLEVYNKQVVFIFDEAHRSQFGEAQRNLKKRFKKYYQFGFTGTPIFPENAWSAETTASVFGRQLHSYVITDAIRDEKVLKFKVDYNNVKPKFKNIETEQDELKLTALETRMAFLHPERVKEVAKYILNNYHLKTHRLHGDDKGFNAMFAVSSIDAAKLYYQTLKELQKDSKRPLKIATIFSYAPNEEQDAIGDIPDENFEPGALDMTDKEFLKKAVEDYNRMFGTSYDIDSKSFQNYYQDLSQRVRNREIDLVIVVGMLLTGFDAPRLNTLFVDKNLRYHGLIQAYSRTNRIYDATKSFGNIVTFRDLEKATIDAITLFGDKNTRNVILEKSFEEYLRGFLDELKNKRQPGFLEVVEELQDKFPEPVQIETEKEKKEFVKLFNQYLKLENILSNYDEFAAIKELQQVDDKTNPEIIENIKEKYCLTDEDIERIKNIELPPERTIQDYKSTYNDIREWIRHERANKQEEESKINWDDIVFEVELLKSQEINLDYILELIYEKHKKQNRKDAIIEDIRRIIRSSIENRAKEDLIIDFISEADLDRFKDKSDLIDAFFEYAQQKQKIEAEKIIQEENLDVENAKWYILTSLNRGFASDQGTELNEILPKMSPLNPEYLPKKRRVFQKLAAFVEKFKGIGGKL